MEHSTAYSSMRFCVSRGLLALLGRELAPCPRRSCPPCGRPCFRRRKAAWRAAKSCAGSGRTRRSPCRRPAALWRSGSCAPSAWRAPPMQATPSLKRPTFSTLKAMWWPLPASPSRFAAGILQSVQHQRAGRRAANSQLVLLGAHGQPRRVALDQKCGELFAVDLGKDGVEAGDAAVGDPHLLAVERVVLPSGESVARVRMFMASEPELASESP